VIDDAGKRRRIYESLSREGLHDAVTDGANDLTGLLVHGVDRAATEEQRQQSITRIQQVRDERSALDIDDRDAQVDQLLRWDAEQIALESRFGERSPGAP
jgi:hypothetical protein